MALRCRLAAFVLVLGIWGCGPDPRVLELRGEIERVRRKPLFERARHFSQIKRSMLDLAERGVPVERVNPKECTEAIRQRLDAFTGQHVGCLSPVERRDLGNGWTMIAVGAYQPCGPDLLVSIYQWGKRRVEVEQMQIGGEAMPWRVDDVKAVVLGNETTIGLLSSVEWCSSTMHPVRLQVFAVQGEESKPLLEVTRRARITSPYRFWLSPPVAFLEFESPEVDDRHVVARYRLNGAASQRIAPLAGSAHEFVLEWREMPLAEAKLYLESDSSSASLLAWREAKQAERLLRPCRFGEEWLFPDAPVSVRDLGNGDYRIRYRPHRTPPNCR